MAETGLLQGRRAVLTGAFGGIGSGLLARLLAEGAEVVACDHPDAAMPDTAATPLAFDISDLDAAAAAAEEIVADGAPDIVISNAGWTRAETFDDVGTEDIRHEVDLNFTGAAAFTNILRKGMRRTARERGGAAFVFVASANGTQHFGNPPYGAAKAALLGWSRAIAVEEGAYGIRSNAVCPGSVMTNAWKHRLDANPDLREQVARIYPAGRLVEVSEVVNAVVFLASAQASGITGAAIPVDGGLTAGSLPFIDLIRPSG